MKKSKTTLLVFGTVLLVVGMTMIVLNMCDNLHYCV